MKLICETCMSWIGNFDPDEISLPLKPEMFKPIVEAPSHHPPFNHLLTWEWFQCPVCRKKPFYLPEKLLTDEGYIDVAPGPEETVSEPVVTEAVAPEPIIEETVIPDAPTDPAKFVCPICGRDDFKLKVSLAGHMRSHGTRLSDYK